MNTSITRILSLAVLATGMLAAAPKASADVLIDEYGRAYYTDRPVYRREYVEHYYAPEHTYYRGDGYVQYYRAPVVVERTYPSEYSSSYSAAEYGAINQYNTMHR